MLRPCFMIPLILDGILSQLGFNQVESHSSLLLHCSLWNFNISSSANIFISLELIPRRLLVFVSDTETKTWRVLEDIWIFFCLSFHRDHWHGQATGPVKGQVHWSVSWASNKEESGLFDFLWVIWLSYIFWMLTPCHMYSLQIFSLFCRLFLCSIVSFVIQRLFSLIWPTYHFLFLLPVNTKSYRLPWHAGILMPLLYEHLSNYYLSQQLMRETVK
jgi:hypothetical protein